MGKMISRTDTVIRKTPLKEIRRAEAIKQEYIKSKENKV
jgi:hypothetical protein